MQTKKTASTNKRQVTLTDLNIMKQRLLTVSKVKGGSSADLENDIKQAITSIEEKLEHRALGELCPPFLPKTVTMYRRQYFLPLKQRFQTVKSSPLEKENQMRMKLVTNFVINFDSQFLDEYFERLREPYIRRIFNENYSMKGIDFKKLNSDQKIRTQIQSMLNTTSEWLIQIEKTQDLLERIELYFDIKTPVLFQRAKKEGLVQTKNRTFSDSFYSFLRNLSSFALRKSAKIIQHSLFSAVAPSAILLTLAIIGGSASLPWQSDLNGKMLITPIMAITVPFILEGLASTIQKVELVKKVEEQTFVLEQVGASIEKFNEQLQTTILLCCEAEGVQEFQKQRVNLQKYVNLLKANLSNLTQFNEETMQSMRERTEAYFKKYIEIKQDEWTVVIPVEQLQNYESGEQ